MFLFLGGQELWQKIRLLAREGGLATDKASSKDLLLKKQRGKGRLHSSSSLILNFFKEGIRNIPTKKKSV